MIDEPDEVGPRPVAVGLERLLRHLGAPPTDALRTVFDGWEDLVGPAVAAHATPRRIRDAVLVVEVSDPAWAAELNWMRQDLLDRIRAATSDTDLTDIRFQVASTDPRRSG